jgi:sarcosine oxidase
VSAIAGVDAVVVGGGIVGLATADALQRRGADVVCLEAGVPGAGQSAGQTRIFRHSHEDVGLVRDAVEALELWRGWERRAGRRLVGDEGALLVRDQIADDLVRLREAGVDAHAVDADAQRAALSAWAPREETPAILEPGGAIRARRAIDTLAAWLGDRLVPGCSVLDLRDDGDATLVLASEGVWRARAVVVCGGVATPALARVHGVEPPIEHLATTRATFALRDPNAPRACLRDKDAPDGRNYYGSPLGSTGMYAVGSPPYPAGDADPQAELARLCAYVEQCLPGVDPDPVFVRTCISTHPEWGDEGYRTFERGRLTFVVGGQLYKFAPLIGDRTASEVQVPA